MKQSNSLLNTTVTANDISDDISNLKPWRGPLEKREQLGELTIPALHPVLRLPSSPGGKGLFLLTATGLLGRALATGNNTDNTTALVNLTHQETALALAEISYNDTSIINETLNESSESNDTEIMQGEAYEAFKPLDNPHMQNLADQFYYSMQDWEKPFDAWVGEFKMSIQLPWGYIPTIEQPNTKEYIEFGSELGDACQIYAAAIGNVLGYMPTNAFQQQSFSSLKEVADFSIQLLKAIVPKLRADREQFVRRNIESFSKSLVQDSPIKLSSIYPDSAANYAFVQVVTEFFEEYARFKYPYAESKLAVGKQRLYEQIRHIPFDRLATISMPAEQKDFLEGHILFGDGNGCISRSLPFALRISESGYIRLNVHQEQLRQVLNASPVTINQINAAVAEINDSILQYGSQESKVEQVHKAIAKAKEIMHQYFGRSLEPFTHEIFVDQLHAEYTQYIDQLQPQNYWFSKIVSGITGLVMGGVLGAASHYWFRQKPAKPATREMNYSPEQKDFIQAIERAETEPETSENPALITFNVPASLQGKVPFNRFTVTREKWKTVLAGTNLKLPQSAEQIALNVKWLWSLSEENALFKDIQRRYPAILDEIRHACAGFNIDDALKYKEAIENHIKQVTELAEKIDNVLQKHQGSTSKTVTKFKNIKKTTDERVIQLRKDMDKTFHNMTLLPAQFNQLSHALCEQHEKISDTVQQLFDTWQTPPSLENEKERKAQLTNVATLLAWLERRIGTVSSSFVPYLDKEQNPISLDATYLALTKACDELKEISERAKKTVLELEEKKDRVDEEFKVSKVSSLSKASLPSKEKEEVEVEDLSPELRKLWDSIVKDLAKIQQRSAFIARKEFAKQEREAKVKEEESTSKAKAAKQTEEHSGRLLASPQEIKANLKLQSALLVLKDLEKLKTITFDSPEKMLVARYATLNYLGKFFENMLLALNKLNIADFLSHAHCDRIRQNIFHPTASLAKASDGEIRELGRFVCDSFKGAISELCETGKLKAPLKLDLTKSALFTDLHNNDPITVPKKYREAVTITANISRKECIEGIKGALTDLNALKTFDVNYLRHFKPGYQVLSSLMPQAYDMAIARVGEYAALLKILSLKEPESKAFSFKDLPQTVQDVFSHLRPYLHHDWLPENSRASQEQCAKTRESVLKNPEELISKIDGRQKKLELQARKDGKEEVRQGLEK